PASRRTRRIMVMILVPMAVLTLAALVVWWPSDVSRPAAQAGGQQSGQVRGTVTAVDERPCPPDADARPAPDPGWVRRCGSARVRLTEGAAAGQEVSIDLPQGSATQVLDRGDDVVLSHYVDPETGASSYAFRDHQRARPMLWLVALAVAAIVAFGRWRGVTSLLGLAASFAVLLLFVLPAILAGQPPLLVAVVGSAAIMFAALYLTHGVTVHTSVAVVGTVASLVITGVLGTAFTSLAKLTGVGGEDTSHLADMGIGVDLRGLLLAGIVIGALGVLDDVTVTQAVTVAEMAQAGPVSRMRLFQAATRVGRAHVGSAVNTIVLAYAGTALPLLLIVAAGPYGVGEVLTSEYIGQEVVRSAVGTIGLVASVPITTALAVLVADVRQP
ncbi:MAG TPA: YibE/F family protein, partial [Pilimelia sp.]|nr:YibE/F family protein [Pilimelia sp.]